MRIGIILLQLFAIIVLWCAYDALNDDLNKARADNVRYETCPPIDLDVACPSWFFHTDVLAARNRMCNSVHAPNPRKPK